MVYERVDDVPLLIGLAQKLQLPELLDRHLGSHGNHQGLSNGTLAVGWIAFILSRGDHTKVHVQEWTSQFAEHSYRLERNLGLLWRACCGLCPGSCWGCSWLRLS
jgi:hypothetical protein